MIERVGVNPDAFGACRPRVLYRLGQEMSPQSASVKVAQQSEVDKLDVLADVAKFEVSRWRRPHPQQPDRYRRVGDIGMDLFIRPRKTIDPVIVAADLCIQESPEGRR